MQSAEIALVLLRNLMPVSCSLYNIDELNLCASYSIEKDCTNHSEGDASASIESSSMQFARARVDFGCQRLFLNGYSDECKNIQLSFPGKKATLRRHESILYRERQQTRAHSRCFQPQGGSVGLSR